MDLAAGIFLVFSNFSKVSCLFCFSPFFYKLSWFFVISFCFANFLVVCDVYAILGLFYSYIDNIASIQTNGSSVTEDASPAFTFSISKLPLPKPLHRPLKLIPVADALKLCVNEICLLASCSLHLIASSTKHLQFMEESHEVLS